MEPQIRTHTHSSMRALLAAVTAVMHERGVDRLSGEALAAELTRRLPQPWWPDRDKGVTAKRLAVLMGRAGAPSVQLGGDSNVRGYRLPAVREAHNEHAAKAAAAAAAEPGQETEI